MVGIKYGAKHVRRYVFNQTEARSLAWKRKAWALRKFTHSFGQLWLIGNKVKVLVFIYVHTYIFFLSFPKINY